jgi:hypothetical protein
VFVSTQPDSGEIRHASSALIRWLNPFDYAYIPAGAVAKCTKRLLVGGGAEASAWMPFREGRGAGRLEVMLPRSRHRGRRMIVAETTSCRCRR